jgi:diketogulonate reductase-like aldo/keto reductase
MAPRLAFSESEKMLTKPIPATDESIPVIGLGTWEVFDVAGSAEEIETRKEIIDMLVARGGSLIDSSPMYNRSEKIVGDIIKQSGNRDELFLATKIWTNGKSRGESQMRRSAELLNAGVIDLMQVHNLRDTDVHMATIRDWQEEGRIRYNGITHYTASAHKSLERAMQKHNPQFVQINYSLGEREAERRVLPMAQDLGIAVLINRPILSQIYRQPPRRYLCDSGDQQAASHGR